MELENLLDLIENLLDLIKNLIRPSFTQIF